MIKTSYIYLLYIKYNALNRMKYIIYINNNNILYVPSDVDADACVLCFYIDVDICVLECNNIYIKCKFFHS